MNTNLAANNKMLPHLTSAIAVWHRDRNLIDGATNATQTSKLLEEFTELVAAQNPTASPTIIYSVILDMLSDLFTGGRIKSVSHEDATSAFIDALGDMYVVQVNLAERQKVSMEDCVGQAWKEIRNRKGQMIDGVFVKEEDLCK